MLTLHRLDVLEGERMVVFGVDGSGRDSLAESFLDGDGHGRSGLTGPDHDHAGARRKGQNMRTDDESIAVEAEAVAHETRGIHRRHRDAEDGQPILATPCSRGWQ